MYKFLSFAAVVVVAFCLIANEALAQSADTSNCKPFVNGVEGDDAIAPSCEVGDNCEVKSSFDVTAGGGGSLTFKYIVEVTKDNGTVVVSSSSATITIAANVTTTIPVGAGISDIQEDHEVTISIENTANNSFLGSDFTYFKPEAEGGGGGGGGQQGPPSGGP